jgi:hypothetical protein
MDSLKLNRNLDQIIDQMSSFAQRAASSEKSLEPARKAFMGKLKGSTLDELNLWKLNFDLMVNLVKQRRDTVWAFILKNAYRPAYLRRTKVDVIVGNPPWLSYRDVAEADYKRRIRELVFKYGLLDSSQSQLFTQMDTSTVFYAHCKCEFLNPGGTIAFVMPKTTILPSKQHIGFQQQGFSWLHDLSNVNVIGTVNKHFFNQKIPQSLLRGYLIKGRA